MFITLLLVTFAISIGVATAVVRLFRSALAVILARLVTEELAFAWHRYMEFAIYVVGLAADKLGNNMDAAEYKHVVLGRSS